MVKNKPATPLPWHTRGPMRGYALFIEAPKASSMPYGLDVCGDDYTGYGDAEAREENMRYIAHVSNAYPKLVEVLQAYARHPNNISQHSARALLTEIGEA